MQKGDQEQFSKITENVALVLMAQKQTGANGIIFKVVRIKRGKTGQHFGLNSGSKTSRMAKLWQFSRGHPKPAFSGKVQRKDQGKFFKNRPKSGAGFKRPKALWRK